MIRLVTLFLLLQTHEGAADVIEAAHTIRANSIITAEDLVVTDGKIAGVVSDLRQIVGQEARVSLYAGRPIPLADIGPPAVVERNQIVPLIFKKGGLHISAEGRSLSRASVGEYIRVMNLSSRTTVFGRVTADGRVFVSE